MRNTIDWLPYNLVVTIDIMKYIHVICIKNPLNLADNGIVDIQNNSLFSYDHPQCFENFVISSNRFVINVGTIKSLKIPKG